MNCPGMPNPSPLSPQALSDAAETETRVPQRALQAQADMLWSLSPLTLPHGLCRVILAEQLYRAVSLLAGHPYHRQ